MNIGRWGVALSLALLALLALAGCASMSEQECLVSDWHAIGFEDGSRGLRADRVGDHRKACADYGVTPDLEAYRAGRREGLRLFCEPSRGFNLGASGARYDGVCPADLEPAFVDSYRAGTELYNLRANVHAAVQQINASQQELQAVEEQIGDKEAALIAPETSTDGRILLLGDLKSLSERKGELEAHIDQLIDDRARHEERLASYQELLARSGY